MRQVNSASEAIDAVGGTSKFAAWWGCSRQSVTGWRKRGFPSTTFNLMREKLRDEHKIDVSPAAWKQK
jgi:hypothetical protein